jgi:hypothetical protein
MHLIVFNAAKVEISETTLTVRNGTIEVIGDVVRVRGMRHSNVFTTSRQGSTFNFMGSVTAGSIGTTASAHGSTFNFLGDITTTVNNVPDDSLVPPPPPPTNTIPITDVFECIDVYNSARVTIDYRALGHRLSVTACHCATVTIARGDAGNPMQRIHVIAMNSAVVSLGCARALNIRRSLSGSSRIVGGISSLSSEFVIYPNWSGSTDGIDPDHVIRKHRDLPLIALDTTQ